MKTIFSEFSLTSVATVDKPTSKKNPSNLQINVKKPFCALCRLILDVEFLYFIEGHQITHE